MAVELLLADDDARLRSLVAERIREEIGPVTAEHGLALFEKLQLEEAIDWLREAAVAVRAAA
jgi:hypothetical protein